MPRHGRLRPGPRAPSSLAGACALPSLRPLGCAHQVTPPSLAPTEDPEAPEAAAGTWGAHVSGRSKATMSRDGVRRLNLRVDVRLSFNDVAAAVAMASYEGAETIAEAGRERLLGWARDGVRDYGLDHIRMSAGDGYEDELAAARRRLLEVGIFPDEGRIDR